MATEAGGMAGSTPPEAVASDGVPVVITLDGPAGVGKTTLARRLAAALGVAFLDTGAMYRAVALSLGENGWDLPEAEVAERLCRLQFSLHGSGDETALAMDGFVLGDELRSEEVGRWASLVARLPAVRECLVAAQRRMGSARSLVAEGRDMGSVVFPHATCKFFLDARPEVRALRRYNQLLRLGQTPQPLEELVEALRLRDEQDRTRAVSPLRPAEDAIMVDTSDLDVEHVFEQLLQQAKACLERREGSAVR